ncbi:MAG: hypothetical protein BRD55_09060 [Bacteroidetes bacterium SW_9_63_38]|nr:MAG: hypothetical protein BRD55_09060 [Bacteroidetes bacterium SW_9_63_38]
MVALESLEQERRTAASEGISSDVDFMPGVVSFLDTNLSLHFLFHHSSSTASDARSLYMTARFESIHHPGDAPAPLIYARRLAGPIGACAVPVMIGATVAALQGQPVWMYTVWGLPGALGVASAWTRFALSATPAELHLRAGQCAVRSVLDVLRNRAPDWHVLYGVEESAMELKLLLGWSTRICRRQDWPRFEQLRNGVQQAARPHANTTPASSP